MRFYSTTNRGQEAHLQAPSQLLRGSLNASKCIGDGEISCALILATAPIFRLWRRTSLWLSVRRLFGQGQAWFQRQLEPGLNEKIVDANSPH